MFPNNTDNLIVFNEFGTQIGAGWQDFSYHSLAYRLAAETLTNYVNFELKHRDVIGFVIMFLYRHSIELMIKDTIYAFHKNNVQEKAKFSNHRIDELWKKFRDLYEENFVYNSEEEKLDFNNAERIILELSKIDPKSFNFRYPLDVKMKKVLEFATVDINNFSIVADKLLDFLGASKDFVENTL